MSGLGLLSEKGVFVKERIMGFLGLFGSSATLLCCALPAALSIIAGGAAVGSLLSLFPWLIPLSQYHNWIFSVAAILLLVNGIFIFRPKGKVACAITGGRGCEVVGQFSKTIFWISIALYTIGLFFTYLYVPLAKSLGGQ
jgi:hypothetical protein